MLAKLYVLYESSMEEPGLDHEVIYSKADLLAAAIYIDRYLLDAINRLEQDFAEIHFLAVQTFRQININKHLLNNILLTDKVEPRDEVTAHLQDATACNQQMENEAGTPKLRLQRLYNSCDRSYTFYRAIAEMNADEDVTRAAQKLASLASDRIGILRHALGKACGNHSSARCY